MGLHALLEWPGQVWVLRWGLGIVGRGRGWCFAVFIKLHIAFRLTVAADTAVALCVDEWAGVAEWTALELPLTQLDGAAAHAQNKALAVVIQAVRSCSQGGVDVGEGHACRYTLLAQGTSAGGVPHLSGLTPWPGGCVVLLKGVYTVVAICWVLLKQNIYICNYSFYFVIILGFYRPFLIVAGEQASVFWKLFSKFAVRHFLQNWVHKTSIGVLDSFRTINVDTVISLFQQQSRYIYRTSIFMQKIRAVAVFGSDVSN